MERDAYILTDCGSAVRPATDEYLYTEINAIVGADALGDSLPVRNRFEQILNDPELHKSMHTPDYFMLVE